jgi:predicted DNA-binding transcriptional regulator AlpA
MTPNETPRYFYWNNDRLLKAEDVAIILDLSIKSIHRLSREGKLQCVQVTSRERRFTPEQVQQYIESRSTEIRFDKKAAPTVSSRPRKGGEKSIGVSGTGLIKEMRSLCRS